VRGYDEHNSRHELKRVRQHQPLDLSIVYATPVRSGQERPADLNLAILLVVAVKARRANHFPRIDIRNHQSTTRREGFLKEGLEPWLLMAILGWMLFPNKGISRNRVEIVVVFRTKRPQLYKMSRQKRLIVKGHERFPLPTDA